MKTFEELEDLAKTYLLDPPSIAFEELYNKLLEIQRELDHSCELAEIEVRRVELKTRGADGPELDALIELYGETSNKAARLDRLKTTFEAAFREFKSMHAAKIRAFNRRETR